MKIAMVSGRYHPYVGGIETVVRQMSEGLVRKGLEVDVLTQDRLQKYPRMEIINGVAVRRFKTGPLGWDFSDSGCTLRGFLRSRADEYDLIHAHGYHCFSPLYAAWAKGRSRLVVNTHYHGIGHNLLMTILLQPYHYIGKTIFEKADAVVCVSETEKRRIARDFTMPADKLSIVPNGVNYDSIAEAIPFPHQGKLLLCVSRLEKFKNIHLAIKALPHLPDEYKLMIVGSGPYKSKLLQLIEKLQLGGRAQILSGLSDQEVYRWYKTSDLVLNLSSQEAFGMTVIEGLAAGKPVLVNDRMALTELATKLDGVRAIDAEKLPAEALAREMAQTCGIVVNKLSLAEYAQDSITERVRALYERVSGNRRAAGDEAWTPVPAARTIEGVQV